MTGILEKERALRTFNHSNSVLYSDACEIPDIVELPCVVKQLTTSGGLGNHIAHTKTELQHVKANGGQVIVEPFIHGRHLGIIGIKDDHRIYFYGIVERFLKPDMTMDRIVFPALLHVETVDELTDFTRYVLNTSGFDFGPFQLEVIFQSDGHIHFVELEPSILGSYISEWMIPAAGCRNMIADAINLATNNPIESHSSTNSSPGG